MSSSVATGSKAVSLLPFFLGFVGWVLSKPVSTFH